MKTANGLALTCALLFVPFAARGGEEQQPRYDWGVAFYMPYDNDLERAGQPIIEQTTRAITTDKVVAAIQADFNDILGMRRISITSKGKTDVRVNSDDSADPKQLISYLRWFTKKYRCKHYALIIMNHGGGLDEMCLDESPDTPGRKWMSGLALGKELRKFAKKMPGKWELLFLQQCGRGSFENLYSFRGTADYVLSSPMRIGAPNTYYASFFKLLREKPNSTGDKLAEAIAKSDKHYFTYFCVRGKKLAEVPDKLNALVAPFLKKSKLTPTAKSTLIYKAKVGKSPMLDAETYFAALAGANGVDRKAVARFFEWSRKELISGRWYQPGYPKVPLASKGPTVHVPAGAKAAEACKRLEIYRDSRLDELWKKLTAAPAAPAKAGK